MMMRAQALALRDRLPLRRKVVGPDAALDAVMEWVARAQDHSGCDGVSAYYDLRSGGWAAAYPETTGYLIPTLFDYAQVSGKSDFRRRALRMADWETAIQFPEGGVQAGTLDARERVPTIFNTGQVLFGWERAYRETGEARYADSLRRAADWLLACQQEDGAWCCFSSPFSNAGVNTYNTRTAYGLLRAGQLLADDTYIAAARRNVAWACSTALPNGWLPNNCLEDNERPLTHTIAYAVRGILEVSAALGDAAGLDLASRAARAVADAQRADGALPGRLNRDWLASVSWSCVTGNAQMAIIWLRLTELGAESALRANAARAIDFCVRQVDIASTNPGVRGGVKGSFPLDGGYMGYRYPNWAAKFLADALMLRSSLSTGGRA